MNMKKTIIIAAIMLLVAGTSSLDARTKKARNRNAKANTTQVIYTGDIASKVIGYNGTTPLNITVKNGVIEDIEVLENQESPGYMKRAVAKVLPQFIGKTVTEALTLDADVATGATYSSDALIKNIQMGLKEAKSTPAKNAAAKTKKKSAGKKKAANRRR